MSSRKQKSAPASPTSSDKHAPDLPDWQGRASANNDILLPDDFLCRYIAFKPLQPDEISEDEVCRKWEISRDRLASMVAEGGLAGVEQECPVDHGLPLSLLPWRVRPVKPDEARLGYLFVAVRYVFKITDVQRYAQVHVIGPLHELAISPPTSSPPSAIPMSEAMPAMPVSSPSTSLVLDLKTLFEKYKRFKLAKKHWKQTSLKDHENRLGFLTEILGNRAVDSITRGDMNQFCEVLQQLPPNLTRSKEYRGKSIAQILEMAPTERLNVKTVNIVLEAVSSCFAWAMREKLMEWNPAQGLQICDDRDPKELCDAFTLEDLQAFFSSEGYLRTKKKMPHRFWVPLIGLYTGMRLEDICQLHCADIHQNNSTQRWVVELSAFQDENLENQKELKTPNAKRIIPLHDALLRAGLLEYLESIRKSDGVRLFPQLRRTKKTPKLGKQVGKFFSALVKDLNITGKKSFHSLRHSFSQYFQERGLHNDVFRQVFGHGSNELAARQYGSKFDAEKCYVEIVSRLEWNLKEKI